MEGTTIAIYIEDEGINEVFADGPDITIAGNGVPRASPARSMAAT